MALGACHDKVRQSTKLAVKMREIAVATAAHFSGVAV
jgi:hypothetical protein